MITNILVPVDGSAHSKKALEYACDLASKYSARLSILHVVSATLDDKVMVMGAANVTIPADQKKIDAAGRSVIEAASRLVEESGCQVSHATVVAGHAASEILDMAKTHAIDTIVIGSRGLGSIAGLLMGSVSHKVSNLAECTCIVVR